MESAIETTLDMSTMEKAHRLAAVAEVLRANRMPQETINMVLAARCGLPMAKVDPKSPCFVWVDESEAVEPVTSQLDNAVPAATRIYDPVANMSHGEGFNELATACGYSASQFGLVARIVIRQAVDADGGGNE